MKYWNKQPRVRATWTKVKLTNITRESRGELKRWCQNNGSTAKFYCVSSATTWPFFSELIGADWWFENPEDATIFVLKWA